MTTSSPDYHAHPAPSGPVSLDELAKQRGVRPIHRPEDLACEGIFETDEELEEFLAFVKDLRHSDMV